MCTARQITRNFYKRIFNIIGSYERVVRVLTDFDSSDNHEVFLQMMAVGIECGYVMRILFGFDFNKFS